MATKRPVLCPICGAQIRKTGYCSACYMHINVVRKAFNTSNYHYNIAYDKAMARDLSGAIESLNTSLRYNKQNIMSRNLLGLIYYEMGEVVMALSQWVMSINYQSTNNLASKYLKELKQDPAGLAEVDQLAKKFNMALSYAHSGDYDLAIIQLKGTLSANPHFVKGYLLLALLYIYCDNYEKARKTLRRVLKIDKANPLAIRYLHEMGDTDENIIHMRMESVEGDGLLDDEYMEEIAVSEDRGSGKSRNTNVFKDIIEKTKNTTVRTGEFGEVGFVKYSGMYVVVGLVLGILLLFFVVMPSKEKQLKNENDKLIKTYSEELSEKNTTIETLNSQINQLSQQINSMSSGAGEEGNPLPDYTGVQHGMSDEDIENLIDNE